MKKTTWRGNNAATTKKLPNNHNAYRSWIPGEFAVERTLVWDNTGNVDIFLLLPFLSLGAMQRPLGHKYVNVTHGQSKTKNYSFDQNWSLSSPLLALVQLRKLYSDII